MAGATCLEAMARTIEDAIVPLILPFVTQVSTTVLPILFFLNLIRLKLFNFGLLCAQII